MSSVASGESAGRVPAATAAGIAAVKGAAPFPAGSIPQPTLQHAMGMFAHEFIAALDVLRGLDDGAWQLPAVRFRAKVSFRMMMLAPVPQGRFRRAPSP